MELEKDMAVVDFDLPEAAEIGRILDGIGAVLTPAQLRLSVVDIGKVNPKAGMPSFHKGEVAAPSGRLTPQEIEDVVAYLASLKK